MMQCTQKIKYKCEKKHFHEAFTNKINVLELTYTIKTFSKIININHRKIVKILYIIFQTDHILHVWLKTNKKGKNIKK